MVDCLHPSRNLGNDRTIEARLFDHGR